MPIASNFLVPNATFIVELVAFLIVLLIIGRYVLPFLNTQLTARQEKIRRELSEADAARAEATAADDERREALEQARHHAREIVAQANATAERVAAEGQARGQEEYERILASAQADIALARQRALEEASSKLGTLVMEVVERIIGREMDAAAHRDLIDEAVQALTASGDTQGAGAGGPGGRS